MRPRVSSRVLWFVRVGRRLHQIADVLVRNSVGSIGDAARWLVNGRPSAFCCLLSPLGYLVVRQASNFIRVCNVSPRSLSQTRSLGTWQTDRTRAGFDGQIWRGGRE